MFFWGGTTQKHWVQMWTRLNPQCLIFMNIYGFHIVKRNIVFQCGYNAILSFIDFPREAAQDMTWYIKKLMCFILLQNILLERSLKNMISRSHHCVTGGVIRGMLPQNVSPPKWGDAAHRDHPMEPTGEGGSRRGAWHSVSRFKQFGIYEDWGWPHWSGFGSVCVA